MRAFSTPGCLLISAALALNGCALAPVQATVDQNIRLWPGAAPGTEDWTGPEEYKEQSGPYGTIHIKSNVTVPSMTVVRPGKANGTAMLVLPGGAFGVLAWDVEGTEIARWLADRGITAFILKYRVTGLKLAPDQQMPTTVAEWLALLEPRRKIAVADAMQAVRLLRANAAEYRIDASRIGMMGFSAGAATTIGAVLEGDVGSRPNFAVPIYGMPMIEPKPPTDAPPLFLVHAQDDAAVPAERSTQMFEAWTKGKRPAELHIYAKGGHGFGMRKQELPLDHWPDAFEAWLNALGLLAPAPGS
jgi:acetyl esterase/lipase